MRKLAITEFVSLDGVMQAPGGEPEYKHTGWVGPYHDDGTLAYKGAELDEFEALLLGRKTYEGFAAAWPERGGEFADRMNSLPKYVVTSTLSDLEWNNSSILEGDAVEAVRELKRGDGGPIIVHGSATLVHALHRPA